MVIRGGKIRIGGQRISLNPSINVKYPSKEGWLTFTLRGKTFYVKMGPKGLKLISIGAGGNVVTGGVTQIGGGSTFGGGINIGGGTGIGGGINIGGGSLSKCPLYSLDDITL